MSGRPRIDPERAEKKCSICSIVKPRAEFPLSQGSVDKMHTVCKVCAATEISVRGMKRLSNDEMKGRVDYYHKMIRRCQLVVKGGTVREIAREEAGER